MNSEAIRAELLRMIATMDDSRLLVIYDSIMNLRVITPQNLTDLDLPQPPNLYTADNRTFSHYNNIDYAIISVTPSGHVTSEFPPLVSSSITSSEASIAPSTNPLMQHLDTLTASEKAILGDLS